MKKILVLIAILLAIFASQAEAKIWVYPATSLTGGGTGALDAIDGQNLQEGDSARVSTSSGTYDYYLDTTSGLAESSPRVIAPDTNAGNKRWILVREPFYYYVNPGATDQGLDGNDYSLYDIAGNIGTTKKATIILTHTGSGTTTGYTIATALDLSSYSNITFQIENGAQLKVSDGVSGVTLPRPSNIKAQPNQQIVSGASLYFSNTGNGVYPGWWGAVAGTGTSAAVKTANTTAINAAWNSVKWRGTLWLTDTYEVNGPLLFGSATNISSLGYGYSGISGGAIKGNGDEKSRIISTSTTNVMDCLQSRFTTFEGFTIESTTAAVGMLFGRTHATTQNCDLNRLRKVNIIGTFSNGNLVTIGAESFHATDCFFYNDHATGYSYRTGYTNDTIAATSTYGTIADASNTDIRFTDCTFYDGHATGKGIYLEWRANAVFQSCDFIGIGGTLVTISTDRTAGGGGTNSFEGPLNFNNCHFESSGATVVYFDRYDNSVANYFFYDINFSECTWNYGVTTIFAYAEQLKTYFYRCDMEIMTSTGTHNIALCAVEQCRLHIPNNPVTTDRGFLDSTVTAKGITYGASAATLGSHVTDLSSNTVLFGVGPAVTGTIPASGTGDLRLRLVNAPSVNHVVTAPVPGEIITVGSSASWPEVDAGTNRVDMAYYDGTMWRPMAPYPGTVAAATDTGYEGSILYDADYIYVCTASGTSGTLVGVTGGISINTPTLVVNDSSGISVGNMLTVVGVSGRFLVTVKAATTLTLDKNADATVAGAAVAYAVPNWIRFAKTAW